VYEQYEFQHAICRQNLAGRDLTEWLTKILAESRCILTTASERQEAGTMKETLCYVARCFEEEMEEFCTDDDGNVADAPKNKTYTMPDGQLVDVGSQMIRCPELMFKPTMNDIELPGIHKKIYDVVYQDCPLDCRSQLLESVVLSGCNTLFPGFAERLEDELNILNEERSRVQVIAPPERSITCWIGGSILASLYGFEQKWIYRSEGVPGWVNGTDTYDDVGPSIIHRLGPERW